MNEFVFSMPTTLIIVGFVLIGVEILVFGLGSFFLLFVSAACFSAALMMKMGLLDQNLLTTMASVAIFSVMWGVALWIPLRKWQSKHQAVDDQPNLINGLAFRLDDTLNPGEHVFHRYSGVSWEVHLAADCHETIEQGRSVTVVKSSVGKFYVVPSA